jgi:thiosulfate reductase cytochrome b subunit
LDSGVGKVAAVVWGFQPSARVHTAAAFSIVVFVVAHVDVSTSGHAVSADLRAMITGWEETEEESRA